MSFLPRSPLPAVLLLTLAACQAGPSQPQTTTTTTAAKPAASTDTISAIASTPGAAYRVFRGLLPGRADSVTVQLVTTPGQFSTYGLGSRQRGSYYGADGHAYELLGQATTPDSVVLSDTSPEHALEPQGASLTWRLRQQPDGSLVGTAGQQATHLRPVLTSAGSLHFAVRFLADSLAALPKDVQSPKARFSVQALLPTGGSPALREALTASILRDLGSDTTGAQAPLQLAALYRRQREAFFQDYRAEAALLVPTDTADAGSYRASLNYTSQQASYVLFRQGDLLSLAYFTYYFTGGAHGNYGTTGASYDLRTGRRLRYADIFRPEAARQLPALLAVAVRPLVGLGSSEPLDKELFVKQMPITHNVFLTTGGVEFIYQPYEIAAYAQGEVRVFLPLGQVRALLRDGLPLPAPASVAKR